MSAEGAAILEDGEADESAVAAIAERLRRLDAVPLDTRRAYAILGPLLRDLPECDHLLLSQDALPAWRVLKEREPEIFLVYRAQVRSRCGRSVSDLLDQALAVPGTGARREIELLSPTELLARPVPIDLIRGMLPAKGLAMLFGESGCGKSFFALALLLAVVLGIAFFGRRVRQGGGVYVAAEGALRGRLEAYARHYGVCLDGLPLRIIEQPVCLRGPGSDTAELIERSKAAAGELGGVALVVIDTLARTSAGGREDAEHFGEWLDSAARIGDALACLVLPLHHSGKNAAAGARGHSSMRAAMDAEIELTKDESGCRTATITKQRDGREGDQLTFRLEAIDLGPHPDHEAEEGAHWGSCVVVPCDAAVEPTRRKKITAGAQVALDALKAALEASGEMIPATSILPRVRAVPVAKWQDCYARIRPIPQDLAPDEAKRERNARRMAFRRAQDELQAVRVAGTEAGFWWLNGVRT